MLNKKIKNLEIKKASRELELTLVYDANCDPIDIEIYKSNVLIDIMLIESQISKLKNVKLITYLILMWICLTLLILGFYFM
jgi:hypothetical protein